MPLNYVALNQRVADALVSTNPVAGLAAIAQEMRYPRGDDFDHNAAELALSRLRRTPPDVEGAAYWLRMHFGTPASAWQTGPVAIASPAAGEPSTGGRKRRPRKTRRHRKLTHRRRRV